MYSLLKRWPRTVICCMTALMLLSTLASFGRLQPYARLRYTPHANDDKNAMQLSEETALSAYGTVPVYSVEPTATSLTFAEGSTPTGKLGDSEGHRPASISPAGLRKTVVMGKLSSEDTSWVEILNGWRNAAYVVDLASGESSPTGFKTAMNKAKEATPYLTYIVDHYEDFPDIAVFLHAHRKGWPKAWHNDARDFDAVNMLRELNLDTVLKRGYVNLRCFGLPGCPAEINLNRGPSEEPTDVEKAYPYVFGEIFNQTLEQVRQSTPIVATPCCAQFAVSKEQVITRPKAEYERYLELIWRSGYDDVTLGTVMEYMWHIIFGQDAVHCENFEQCQWNVYGREGNWAMMDE